MTTSQYVFIWIIGIVIALAPFAAAPYLMRFLKVLFYIATWPYFLWKKYSRWRKAKTRRRNYEVLGNYISLLGNNPDSLSYFKALIEDGISEEKFLELLETNVIKLRHFENNKKREEIRSQLEEQEQVKAMANEQQELLAKAEMGLEQIHFKQKLLDNFYRKIQKKYRM